MKLAKGPNGKQYAMKIFDHSNPRFDRQAMGNFHSEIIALKKLNHKHVVSYYDAKEEAKMIRPEGKQPKKVSYIV